MAGMKFGNDKRELRREKQWKIGEVHELLNCNYGDIKQINRDTYVNILDNKKYSVIARKNKFVVTEIK